MRRVWPYLLLSVCIGAATLAGYMLYLDHAVRAKFEGTRWSLPAKVYARPLQLYSGLDLSRQALVARLRRLGYRDSRSIGEPGTYAERGQQLRIHTRAFTFWDGAQPAREVGLAFANGRIDSLAALDDRKAPALLRLDPLLIGSIYPNQGEDRILVKLGAVPPLLAAGLITVEDRSFMDNYGVSPKAIARAAWADLRAGRLVQGGSTITQQLVKNFYLNNRRTLGRKLKEALMAILLDAHYTKPEILQAYINEVYLGQDGSRAIHGFGLASYFYFRKPLAELQPHEIALLVAMVKGPSYYDPRRHPKRARARRDLVLDLFHRAGMIDDAAWHKAKQASLGVTARSVRGTSQYPAFIELVRRQLHGQYADSDLTREGLRVFTTLDPAIQARAERALDTQLDRVEKAHGIKKDSLQAAAVVTSVEGGHVLALVGGRDAGYAGFNRALDTNRPVGSLIKPVVYLTALSQPTKYNLITPVSDMPLAVKLANGKTWRPDNYSGHSHGPAVPLHYALAHSYNHATARLAVNLGISNVIDTLNKLGYRGKPLAVPSLALGAVGMAPFEVAQIYNTLAAGGYYTPLLAIRDVTTRQGKPLNRYALKIKQVLPAAPVYLTDWILRRVARYGTGKSAYNVLPGSLQIAGKTGTTNDLRDSWFAGFAANRLAVVWVGRDDNQSAHLTGATGALQLWSHIMAGANPRSLTATAPRKITELPLRMRFGAGGAEGDDAFAYSRCSDAVRVPFIRGNVPDGLSACDSDMLALNQRNRRRRAAEARRRQQAGQQRDKDNGNWFQRLFQ